MGRGASCQVGRLGENGTLRNQYLHYTYRDISDHIQTIDRYSKTAAEEMMDRSKPFRLVNLLFSPPFRFFKDYILKLGFLDGIPGLIIAMSTAYYAFIKHAKLWEHEFLSRPKDDQGGL